MGTIKIPIPVKLVCAITFVPCVNYESLIVELESVLGRIDFRSEIFDFEHTCYYEEEMGSQLKKQYVSFAALIPAEWLPSIKIRTNLLEKRFMNDPKRMVNIDPGYIEKAKLVLATTKNFSHRIYLGSGIFGDLQYRFRHKTFTCNEWTYPDYREGAVIAFFNRIREKYCSEVDTCQEDS